MVTEGTAMAAMETELPIYEEPSTPIHYNSNCCFCFPCFSHRRSSHLGPSFWERVGSGEHDDKWWARGLRTLKKAREWSEIAAGPRWKTFIRRFNRSRSGSGGAGHNRHGKYNYDPLSYSLNFDEGPGQSGDFEEEDDQYAGFRNFSARFASVAAPVKPVAADIGKGKEVLPVFG